jgi:hypothetical protein
VGAFVALATAAVFSYASHQLGATTSFIPAMVCAVVCFDAMSAYLLIGDYLDNGDVRILIMTSAYL